MTLTQWIGLGLVVVSVLAGWRHRSWFSKVLDECADEMR